MDIKFNWDYSEFYDVNPDGSPSDDIAGYGWSCWWNLVPGALEVVVHLDVSQIAQKKGWTVECTLDFVNQCVDSVDLFKDSTIYLDPEQAKKVAEKRFTEWVQSAYGTSISMISIADLADNTEEDN